MGLVIRSEMSVFNVRLEHAVDGSTVIMSSVRRGGRIMAWHWSCLVVYIWGSASASALHALIRARSCCPFCGFASMLLASSDCP